MNVCLKIADDLQLFKELGPRTSQPKTTTELASSSHADPALLGRILRHLAGNGVITQLAGDGNSYRATELSETLASPEGSSGIRSVAKVYTPVFQHLPDFLKSIDYKVPRDTRNGPFQQTIIPPGEWVFSCLSKISSYCDLSQRALLQSGEMYRVHWATFMLSVLYLVACLPSR